MNNLTVGGRPAVRIKAVLLKGTERAILCDCEGDEIWFPRSTCEYEEKEQTLLVELSFFNKLESEGVL